MPYLTILSQTRKAQYNSTYLFKNNLSTPLAKDNLLSAFEREESISNPESNMSIKRQDVGDIFIVNKTAILVKMIDI